ncbi:glycosyltransferase [Bradyrhizobium jicamae]|uniref:Glycosyltransferase n=1 Tax=Bradyrhizobium jicamae TaxID=280332 RepID=A0ABS5FGR4_9BRAD|nr:glycosyltransferase [Bradyrhizobium jicamae]MBR0795970.1 glycosyltransferase [Bradyrhizobium jicamae]MBR0935654.1 glycosyltransferase [Bradyrhizobium jicamae]
MRILHFTDCLRIGGRERQIAELMKGLRVHRDIESFVAVASEETADDWEIDRQHVQIIPIVRRSRRDLRIFKTLYELVTNLNIDIVHSWGSMCSVYAAPVAKLCGAAFVNGFVRDAPHMTLWNKHYLRGKLTSPFSDVVVANSRAGLAAYDISERRGVCIYNGFNPERVLNLTDEAELRRTLGLTTPNIVGMVANFTPYKDYAVFVEMARRICQLRDDVTFLAVGDGPTFSQMRDSVPSGQLPRLKFLGRRNDVENIANLFTVGVLATNSRLHGEGISNAITEIMALGKPVVATDDGGTPELVLDGQTGFLVPSHDADALTDRVLRLVNDVELATRLGMQGRRRIETTFSLDKMTNSYLGLYRGLMDRAGTRDSRRGAIARGARAGVEICQDSDASGGSKWK